MEIKINKEKIEKNIGIFIKNDIDYFNYLKVIIDDLATHNKNYNRSQYFNILQIKEILDNMEVK